MDWKHTYSERRMTAAEAVRKIKSGDRVVVGHASGSPEVLLGAMMENRSEYKDVEIVIWWRWAPLNTQGENAGHFLHNSLFAEPQAGSPSMRAGPFSHHVTSARFPGSSPKRNFRWT